MSQAKRLEFAVGIDETGMMYAEAKWPLTPGGDWTPEHLLLAALGRCSMASLRYHAKRAGATVDGRVTTSGAVTRRDDDGRYAFVEEHVGMDVTIRPTPVDAAMLDLLAKAQRDCFVGASLQVPPQYSWRVNDETVDVEPYGAQAR
jgi:organic hydroperoxide reductase OsmC/OhrA